MSPLFKPMSPTTLLLASTFIACVPASNDYHAPASDDHCAQIKTYEANSLPRSVLNFCEKSEGARTKAIQDVISGYKKDATNSCDTSGSWRPKWLGNTISCRGPEGLNRISIGVTQYGRGNYFYLGVDYYENYDLHRLVDMTDSGTLNEASERAYLDSLPQGI